MNSQDREALEKAVEIVNTNPIDGDIFDWFSNVLGEFKVQQLQT